MEAILLILSAILEIVAPITYMASILKGKTEPRRMTRFILLFVLSLNFFGIVAAKGNLGAVVFSGINVAQATIIFLLSLKRGMGGTSAFDWLCLVVAGIGIVGWKITGNPISAIWFAIVANFFGYLPVILKTWKHPHTESAWYYFLGGFSALISFVAFKVDATSIFQIYIAICCFFMIGLIYRNQIQKYI